MESDALYPALAFLEGPHASEFTNVTYDVRNGLEQLLMDNETASGSVQGTVELGFPPKNSFFGLMRVPAVTESAWVLCFRLQREGR